MRQISQRLQNRVFNHPSGLDVIGHRGFGSGVREGVRENSSLSIQKAVAAGVDWVEIDVRRSAEASLQVHHHNALTDTRLVSEASAAEAQEVGIGDLASICQVLPHSTGLNIEIKPTLLDATLPADETTGALVIDYLRATNLRCPLLLTSFDAATVNQLTKKYPEVACGFLTWIGYPLEIAIATASHLEAGVVAVHVSSLGMRDKQLLPKGFAATAIATCHELGIEVMVWGAVPRDIAALKELGVAAVCVDRVTESLAQRAQLD